LECGRGRLRRWNVAMSWGVRRGQAKVGAWGGGGEETDGGEGERGTRLAGRGEGGGRSRAGSAGGGPMRRFVWGE